VSVLRQWKAKGKCEYSDRGRLKGSVSVLRQWQAKWMCECSETGAG